MHVKDPEKENKNLKVRSFRPWPEQSICLPLHSTWVSQPPAPQTFLPGRSLERVLILEGAFIKTIWCKPPFLLPKVCLFSNMPAWSRGGIFVWSSSCFMDCSWTLESLEYFNYENYHVLGPFGLTRLLSFLCKPGCVCLRRKCTLSEHSDCFNIHLDRPMKNRRLRKLRWEAGGA